MIRNIVFRLASATVPSLPSPNPRKPGGVRAADRFRAFLSSRVCSRLLAFYPVELDNFSEVTCAAGILGGITRGVEIAWLESVRRRERDATIDTWRLCPVKIG